MNNYKGFLKAEEFHRKIVSAKQERLFDSNMIANCRQAIQLYVSIALIACDAEVSGSLTTNVLTLQEKSSFDATAAYEKAAIIESAYLSELDKQAKEIHLVCSSYLSLRTSVLEWLIENRPPVFDNGKCYHEITGVTIEAESYSYVHTLELYYGI